MFLVKPQKQSPSATGNLYLIPDSISHSGGIITAIIGSASYTVTISGLAANTRYQLYLTPGGSLVYSVNENSVGPGTSQWVLVGCFYSNYLSSFGGFVNIEGRPVSEEIVNGPVAWQGSSGNPTKPSMTVDFSAWFRDGSYMEYWYAATASGSGSGGSGAWLFPLPTNIAAVYQRVNGTNGAVSNADILGDGRWGNASTAYLCQVILWTTTSIAMQAWENLGALVLQFSGSAQVTAATNYGGFRARIPVSSWSNTAIKDL